MKLLIIEDEIELCDSIAKGLKISGYEIDTCHDGIEASFLLETEAYDLIILDLNLPGMDGMEILKKFRNINKNTHVLILSARDQIQNRVDGLDAGANDFLCKPFYFEELEARIRSLTRRQSLQNPVILRHNELWFNTKTRIAYVHEEKLNLTRKETILLEYLMLNNGRPVSQEELINHAWDSSVNAFSNSVRVHISSLRKKLRNLLNYDPIINQVRAGYIFGEPEK
ncbi:response regulator transcription factor [Clostridium butyricum]|uniref:response regulator transcription factor n=1 Tax=Clostridium butyricum TaxID=1492 RepID=UPI0022DEBACD|nr:response regulator transcription factor [Clostridium butyricum]